jgi:chromosome segregation ATPase
MTSKPAASHVQALDRDEPLEAAKIPLKNKGLDIASQMRSVKQAEPDLASAVGNYSASIEQTLSVIEAIEETLRHKRRQIEEIQTRQEALALEYRRLGGSLVSVSKDLAQQFAGIISDLETDIPSTDPPADNAPESDANAEPLVDSTHETGEASDLDLETSDLPPVPEFLGERQKQSEQA